MIWPNLLSALPVTKLSRFWLCSLFPLISVCLAFGTGDRELFSLESYTSHDYNLATYKALYWNHTSYGHNRAAYKALRWNHTSRCHNCATSNALHWNHTSHCHNYARCYGIRTTTFSLNVYTVGEVGILMYNQCFSVAFHKVVCVCTALR